MQNNKQKGKQVITSENIKGTKSASWKISEIQRMNKDAGLITPGSTTLQKKNMAARPFAWKHNQRLKSVCTLPGKIKKIYGQARLTETTDKFSTTSLYQTKVRGQIHYESAEKCIPLRDIGAYDSNLYLGPDTGQDLPCTSVIIKVDPEDLGKKMAKSFQGWHYSSTNALGRTTHAIVPLSTRFQTVIDHLNNFSTNEKSSRDEYNFYKDLQTVMSQHNRSQPNNWKRTPCSERAERGIDSNVMRCKRVRPPNSKYYVIVREICGHLDDLIEAAAGAGTGFQWRKEKNFLGKI